ncbi:SH3 domain-binding protein 5-like isoform X2 [Ruditapes philippinarum]|uniref:SH3 domain-binding protein 5-like isoform X2 n=1 Tax=Ruditapes philippinarum TaxID=129788 RepID=UPI00295B4838|nr:SH3 domain-binding protein 5-like isoform X2 [Ruditapes philippinarum]
MADSEGRLSPSCLGEFEDEALDPRIQDELERLNKASEEINRLELELDDARASFRQALTDSTYKLDALAKKLGSCVDKARPYYEARLKSKEVHVETQKAAYMFERACSMHEAAKEMVQLAEQGYMQREDSGDPAWQEMLNHATMKVNDAEMERLESEKVHLKTTQKFKEAEEQVLKLQKDLKRSINKSKPYFEMKAKFNQMMEDRKSNVMMLEESVAGTKKTYSDALRSLEEISEAIHQKRIDMRNQAELGIRGAGVGSESPSPPPMRGKVHVPIDGKTTHLASSCNTGNSPTTVTSAQFSVSDTSSQDFRPPSVIYSSPEKARRESYRQAIEARQSMQGNLNDIGEDYSVNLDDEYLALPKKLSKNSSNEDVSDDIFDKSKDGAATQDSLSIDTNTSDGSSNLSTSPAGMGKKPSSKLKGLILVPVGAGMDPLQANIKITTKPHVARSRTEPIRPMSYPYTHNTDNKNRVVTPTASSSTKEEKKVGMEEEITTPSSEKSFRRLLKVPSVQDFDEGSISDTESITSGTMLDDDQVEFLTMDFSKCRLDSLEERQEIHEYRRFSLPPTLSQVETFVRQVSNENEASKSPEGLGADVNDTTNNTLTAENIVDPDTVYEV